ncbi:YdiK family protein [Mesobacillus thioparans]|uniref:YdiK family protein n=1 Tax=Mesobacillus thioparans TaxID=370439 RepID=UPI0039F041B2
MKQSPMFSGIVYILLGILFTYFAIQNVNDSGWGFFSYLLVLLATFDFGSGIRMILFHFKLKQMQKK